MRSAYPAMLPPCSILENGAQIPPYFSQVLSLTFTLFFIIIVLIALSRLIINIINVSIIIVALVWI